MKIPCSVETKFPLLCGRSRRSCGFLSLSLYNARLLSSRACSQNLPVFFGLISSTNLHTCIYIHVFFFYYIVFVDFLSLAMRRFNFDYSFIRKFRRSQSCLCIDSVLKFLLVSISLYIFRLLIKLWRFYVMKIWERMMYLEQWSQIRVCGLSWPAISVCVCDIARAWGSGFEHGVR